MVSQAFLHQGPEALVGLCVHSLSGQLITWPLVALATLYPAGGPDFVAPYGLSSCSNKVKCYISIEGFLRHMIFNASEWILCQRRGETFNKESAG